MEASNLNVQVFEGEYDNEGVYIYQAYCNDIADWAIENQRLGGPLFNASRMTWIKPSFAWVLYRSGYAQKHNQERILKIKISHHVIAQILKQCSCKHGGGGSFGIIQWDPARDILTVENSEPRKMQSKRAIQIGIKGHLSELYVSSILSIQDVTTLAHLVGIAHNVLIINNNGNIVKNKKHNKNNNDTIGQKAFLDQLPIENAYIPHCEQSTLERLGMQPGETANIIAGLGKGGRYKNAN